MRTTDVRATSYFDHFPARRLSAVCLLASAATSLAAQQTARPVTVPASIAGLRAAFATPPAEARLRCYWWWLNGHTDAATITHDLEEMKAKGFGGALLVDANGSNQVGNTNVPAGPTFASPEWVGLYTHALREADRLGLEITLNITSGWNLGSPDVRREQASKVLTWTRTAISGGGHINIQLAAPAARNGFYRNIAVLAYPLHAGSALRPALRGLGQRSAAAETGFSMSDSTWMLDSAGTPAGGSGLNRPSVEDLRLSGGGEEHARNTLSPSSAADTSLAEVRDLTSLVSGDGNLVWEAPAGTWEVLRIGYTNSDAHISTSSGAWQGHVIDYLSRDAFNTYWDHTVEPLLAAAKPYRSLKFLATDSWELGGTNWTEGFAEEFGKRRGYDPRPWLPVLAGRVLESPDASTRFLTDLRRTVADLIADNHYAVFAARAREHGLGTQAESGGPHGAPIDALQTFAYAAVPQTEFWSVNPHRDTDPQRFFLKEAASAANIYGKRFVAAEGETSIGPQWSESLATDLKPSFDMAITEGMNRLVWHEFTSSPADTGLPGQEYFAGTHLNPKVTWWNAGVSFFAYLNRVQALMQLGTPVNDLLYFYGDNVPAFVRLKADDPAAVLPGYDYDVTDEDALLRTIHIEQQANGSAVLLGPSGLRWRALALPKSGRLSFSALQRVAGLLKEGAQVVGLPPTSATGRLSVAQDAAFANLVQQVWGNACAAGSRHAYGKGAVYCMHSAHEALMAMNVLPDAEVVPSAPSEKKATSAASFDYAHRRAGTNDVYFVRNGSDRDVQHDIAFRAQAASVELWDAVTGSRTRLQAVAYGPGRTLVPMRLPAFGSAFVVFTNVRSEILAAASPRTRKEPMQEASWTISFQPERGAPTQSLPVTGWKSWTEWPQSGVRYFSGSATYSANVTAPSFSSGERVLLRFPDVREIARVKINGHDAGTVWAKPLTLRVDPWLKPGSNRIEIEVTNLWPNRIIGDQQAGVTNRITSTNITAYHADSLLLPSGLIGAPEWVIEERDPHKISASRK